MGGSGRVWLRLPTNIKSLTWSNVMCTYTNIVILDLFWLPLYGMSPYQNYDSLSFHQSDFGGFYSLNTNMMIFNPFDF